METITPLCCHAHYPAGCSEGQLDEQEGARKAVRTTIWEKQRRGNKSRRSTPGSSMIIGKGVWSGPLQVCTFARLQFREQYLGVLDTDHECPYRSVAKGEARHNP